MILSEKFRRIFRCSKVKKNRNKMQRYAVQTTGAVMRILHSSLEKATKGDDSPVRNAEVVIHAESN